MSDQIKVGDTVMIVKPKPCCSNGESIDPGPRIFVVERIEPPSTGTAFWICAYCRTRVKEPLALDASHAEKATAAPELSRLIKLSGPATELGEEEYAEIPGSGTFHAEL